MGKSLSYENATANYNLGLPLIVVGIIFLDILDYLDFRHVEVMTM